MSSLPEAFCFEKLILIKCGKWLQHHAVHPTSIARWTGAAWPRRALLGSHQFPWSHDRSAMDSCWPTAGALAAGEGQQGVVVILKPNRSKKYDIRSLSLESFQLWQQCMEHIFC